MNKKIACITGGGKRIGAHLCINLAKHGYDIALHYNKSQQDAEETQSVIRNLGGRCALFHADLTCYDQIESMSSQIRQQFDRVDLLINSASPFLFDNIHTLSEEQFDFQNDAIYKAPLFLSQKLFSKQQQGHIINFLDSTSVESSASKKLSYWLAKKSCEHLTDAMALALAPYIRVNAIAPGYILDPVNEIRTEIEKERKVNLIPMKKQGDLSDIFQAVLSLELLTYTTGQVLYVDGGKHLITQRK